MGTGVGEAMLIGAAVGATAGGAGAAIQGGDPLKGALTGGAMGAVGGGLGAGFGAAGGAAEGAVAGGSTAGGGAGAGAGAGTSSFGLGATGATNTGIGSIYAGAAPSIQGATNLGAGISGAGTAGGYGLTAGSGAVGGAPVLGSVAAPTTAGSIGGTSGAVSGGATGAGTNIFGQTLGQPGVLTNTQLGMTAGTTGLAGAMQAERDKYGIPSDQGDYNGPLTKLKYDPAYFRASTPAYAPASVYRPSYAAEGGIMRLAAGGMPGPVERMSENVMGGTGNMFPQSQQEHTNFATPTQMPTSAEIIRSDYDAKTDPYTGVMTMAGGGIADLAKKIKMMKDPNARQSAQLQGLSPDEYVSIYGEGVAAQQQAPQQQQPQQQSSNNDNAAQLQFMRQMGLGFASGGISSLGSYSDGGRMLKGAGDGMSDSIPGIIGGKQPARLADGEFVVPADVVSHLGNGSTDAGAKQLYSMMDRVRKARTGTKKQGKQIKPQKFMAA